MNHFKKSALCVLLFGCISFMFQQGLTAQNAIPDSIKQKSYSELNTYFSKTYVDTLNDLFHAKVYLSKAKEDRDSIKMANAYFYLSETYPLQKGIIYADSIISVTKNNTLGSDYPALGYLQKGKLYYRLGKYKEALGVFLTSLEHAEEKGNKIQILSLKVNIASLKLLSGERDEALKIYKEYEKFVEDNEIPNQEYYALNGILAIANTYVYNKQQDSADIYIRKGMEKSLVLKDTLMYANFLLRSGINSHYKHEYSTAIDSLSKGKKIINDDALRALANLYLGKSHAATGREYEAILFFALVDSFLEKTNNVIPELIEAYDPLIEYYKERANYNKHIYYINKLLKYDSILDSNNKFLSRNISKNYDIPRLISERNGLIDELNEKNKLSNRNSLWLLIFSIVLLIVSAYYLRKTYVQKRRFIAVIEEYKNKLHLTSSNKTELAEISNTSIKTELPQDLVQKILAQLDTFESSHRFVKRKYTLNSLAKEMNTNSAYLSKIINITKGVNFSNYLNSLRIEYAIETLSSNKELRSYTIKAIAEEVGFNTAQSFSVAFHKKTGIYPSYFIKQLEKQY